MSDIMITVSGRPGCGKSWLAVHLADYLSKLGKTCVHFVDEKPALDHVLKLKLNKELVERLHDSNIVVKTSLCHRPWTVENELQNKHPNQAIINFKTYDKE